MTLILDITGPARWELAYSTVEEAPADRVRFKSQYNRLIDPFDLPITFDSHVLAVGAIYKKAPPTWYNAGQLIQLVDRTSINDPSWDENGSTPEPVIIDRKNVRLNQSLELLVFQKVSGEMRLGFNPRPWIPRLLLRIFAYRGPVSNSTDDLVDAARAQLTTMDAKLDRLLQ